MQLNAAAPNALVPTRRAALSAAGALLLALAAACAIAKAVPAGSLPALAALREDWWVPPCAAGRRTPARGGQTRGSSRASGHHLAAGSAMTGCTLGHARRRSARQPKRCAALRPHTPTVAARACFANQPDQTTHGIAPTRYYCFLVPLMLPVTFVAVSRAQAPCPGRATCGSGPLVMQHMRTPPPPPHASAPICRCRAQVTANWFSLKLFKHNS